MKPRRLAGEWDNIWQNPGMCCLRLCIRLKSELQYEYFTELILEAAKTAEKLTEKMRRLTLEVTINPVQYERYKEELVMIHGIEVEYEKKS